jgi:hypothetical protein
MNTLVTLLAAVVFYVVALTTLVVVIQYGLVKTVRALSPLFGTDLYSTGRHRAR